MVKMTKMGKMNIIKFHSFGNSAPSSMVDGVEEGYGIELYDTRNYKNFIKNYNVSWIALKRNSSIFDSSFDYIVLIFSGFLFKENISKKRCISNQRHMSIATVDDFLSLTQSLSGIDHQRYYRYI